MGIGVRRGTWKKCPFTLMGNFIINKAFGPHDLHNRPQEGQFCNESLKVGELGSRDAWLLLWWEGGWHSCGLFSTLLCPLGHTAPATVPVYMCMPLLYAGPSCKGIYKKAGAYLSSVMFTGAIRSWAACSEKAWRAELAVRFWTG